MKLLIFEGGANNVIIENSTVAFPSNGLIVGTSNGNITNSIFRNIIADGVQHGIHLKALGDLQNGTQKNITFYNISFINVFNGIDLNSYNQSIDGIDNKSNVGWVIMEDIRFENVYGTYQEYCGHIDCPQQYPCHDLLFENIFLEGVFTGSQKWQCSDNVYGAVYNVTPHLHCLQNGLNSNYL